MSSRDEFLAKFRVEPNANTHIGKIIAVSSGKGGVGKSLITALLAVYLNRRGYKVGILDGDITGPSIPQVFGLHDPLYGSDEGIIPAYTPHGIQVVSSNLLLEDPSQPIIWRSPVITGMLKQFYSEVYWGELDYLLVDLPPGTADIPLTIYQSLPIDGVVIVTTPQDLVSMIVRKSMIMAENLELPVLGVVQNMSYVVCDVCGHEVQLFGDRSSLIKQAGVEIIEKMPLDPKITDLCDSGLIENIEDEYLQDLLSKIENM